MPENPDTVQFTDAPTETDMVAILDELCADNDWREDWANVREAYEHALRLWPQQVERLTDDILREREVARNVRAAMVDMFGETIRDEDLPALMRRQAE